MVYPLADDLVARGVRVLLLSGYGAANLPPRLRGLPRLTKPHDATALIQEIHRIAAEMRGCPERLVVVATVVDVKQDLVEGREDRPRR